MLQFCCVKQGVFNPLLLFAFACNGLSNIVIKSGFLYAMTTKIIL